MVSSMLLPFTFSLLLHAVDALEPAVVGLPTSLLPVETVLTRRANRTLRREQASSSVTADASSLLPLVSQVTQLHRRNSTISTSTTGDASSLLPLGTQSAQLRRNDSIMSVAAAPAPSLLGESLTFKGDAGLDTVDGQSPLGNVSLPMREGSSVTPEKETFNIPTDSPLTQAEGLSFTNSSDILEDTVKKTHDASVSVKPLPLPTDDSTEPFPGETPITPAQEKFSMPTDSPLAVSDAPTRDPASEASDSESFLHEGEPLSNYTAYKSSSPWRFLLGKNVYFRHQNGSLMQAGGEGREDPLPKSLSAYEPDHYRPSYNSEYFGPFRLDYSDHTIDLSDWNFIVESESRIPGRGNLVVGRQNFVGDAMNSFVAGKHNTARGKDISVAGGIDNIAAGNAAVVVGGEENVARGNYTTTDGGYRNEAATGYTVAAGGTKNLARGLYAVASGGEDNIAIGPASVVTGGRANEGLGSYASVHGGSGNKAFGNSSVVSAGLGQTASHTSESISKWLTDEDREVLKQPISGSGKD